MSTILLMGLIPAAARRLCIHSGDGCILTSVTVLAAYLLHSSLFLILTDTKSDALPSPFFNGNFRFKNQYLMLHVSLAKPTMLKQCGLLDVISTYDRLKA